MNPAAIEAHLKVVLVQWLVIIAAAWFFGRLGRRLGQPLAVGEILAGILLGPSALGLLWPSHWPPLFPPATQQSLQLLGKVGLILFLFQVGMEFDYGHLRARSGAVVAISLCGILAPFLAGLMLGPWLHRSFAPELPRLGFMLFVCIALSISALPIMGRILLEMGLERTPLGAVAISSAAIDDVIGWILLALASALVTSGFDVWRLTGQVVGILVFFFALQKWVGPGIRRLWGSATRHSGPNQMPAGFLALVLIVLFSCCLVTNALGVFAIFGAFLFGVSLHQEERLVKAWRERFSDFVLVALVPIFFTNTGLNTSIDSLTTSLAWMGTAAVVSAAVAGKLGGCYLGARLMRVPTREAASIAALMNTRALMGLIAINVGLDLKLLTRELFTMFVLMALLTTAMTGPLLRRWLPSELKSRLASSRVED